jgi:hypothetical protein
VMSLFLCSTCKMGIPLRLIVWKFSWDWVWIPVKNSSLFIISFFFYVNYFLVFSNFQSIYSIIQVNFSCKKKIQKSRQTLTLKLECRKFYCFFEFQHNFSVFMTIFLCNSISVLQGMFINYGTIFGRKKIGSLLDDFQFPPQ